MYKVKVECFGKPCEVELMSKEEIKEVVNNGAKVSIIAPVTLTKSQITQLAQAIQSTQKPTPNPRTKKTDGCTAVEKYKLDANSCYMDSLTFALFAFPTEFIKHHILGVDLDKLRKKVEKLEIDYIQITDDDVNKIMEYIERVHGVLLEINDKFRGSKTEDYCKNLRPILLKTPTDVLKGVKVGAFSAKKQEDVGELLQAIYNTFLIDNTDIVIDKTFINTIDKGVPPKQADPKMETGAPFYVLMPEKDKKLTKLSFQKQTELDIENYYYDMSKKPTDRETISKIEGFKKLQMLSILTKFVSIVVEKGKSGLFSDLKDGKLEAIPQGIIDKKQLQLVNEYSLLDLVDCFNRLKSIYSSLYNSTISPEITKVKQNPALKYYQSQVEINKLIKYYYNSYSETIDYVLGGYEYDHFMTVYVNRFARAPAKDMTAIDISETLGVMHDTLQLNQIVVHSGSSVTGGHYTTCFRCNDMWYLYNNISNDIETIGDFNTLLTTDNGFYRKNSVLLIYSELNPTA
jgi:hypothetical protein